MSIITRSLIVGSLVAVGVAFVLWSRIEYPDLVIAFGVISVFAGMALGSWWSAAVVPTGFVGGFALIAAYVVLSGEAERVTDGFVFQLLFVVLNGAFGILLAALGTLIVKLLGPDAAHRARC